MLDGFARHGLFDLELHVSGDLDVDCHHTIEDVGIVLGGAIREALGDKAGIKRYGSFLLPMDETLAMCAIDLSGLSLIHISRNIVRLHWRISNSAVRWITSVPYREFQSALMQKSAMPIHFHCRTYMSIRSVSYTHLDVYKRQRYHRDRCGSDDG